MVCKCGSEMSPHIPEITKLCLKYLTYDPNYNYNDEDDSDMECDDEVGKGYLIDFIDELIFLPNDLLIDFPTDLLNELMKGF